MLNSYFISSYQTLLFLQTQYNLWLVSLSLLVAISTSCLALQMAGFAREATEGNLKKIALVTGSIAMGGGIWAMHFVGMLAFSICSSVHYALLPTLFSMLPAIGAAWFALRRLAQPSISQSQLWLSGTLVGSGIGIMHYSGMAAMNMAPQLRYDPLWFAASIMVAVLLSTLALWIRFGLDSNRLRKGYATLLGGGVMGVAIAGMHYFGMAAARFIGTPQAGGFSSWNDNASLAIGIAVLVLMLGNMVLAGNVLLRYRMLYQKTQANELKLQTIVSTTIDGMITFDAEGRIESLNPAAERLFGWMESDVKGCNIQQLIPARYQQGRQMTSPASLPISEIEEEAVGRRKDGTQFPIRLAIGKGALPAYSLYVGFITDISERHRMQRELEEQEQQFHALIDNIPGVTFRSEAKEPWNKLFISEDIQELSGWPSNIFMSGGMHIFNIIHPEDQQRVRDVIHNALNKCIPYTVEYRIRCMDGTECWVSESARGVFNEVNQAVFIDGLILDVSERKLMELAMQVAKESAESAARSKSAFLANMSHEIRTPMNAIIGYTDLLQDFEIDAEPKKMIEIINQSAKGLLGLINDILDTAKLEQGAVELEELPFSLRNVCQQTIDTLKLTTERKGISLIIEYPESINDHFMGDAMRIRQILLNLMSNAVKFTEKGEVRLKVSQHTGIVELIVVDTGIGMNAVAQAKLFKPFSQADASTSRRFGGTGLGTTIALELVKKMGGSIGVESTAGKGSTFTVRIPLVAAQSGQIVKPVVEDANLPPLDILVADDVVQNLNLIKILLKKRGHTVTTAMNGKEVLQLWSQHDFDIILMDVQMPIMDGLETCRVIRSSGGDPDKYGIPIIALTASVLQEDRAAAMAVGMSGFASKPIDIKQLDQEMKRALQEAYG
ncbi:MHYT domain-containing protein [Aquitalea aquatilis]|uniref:MHYT domain-containing protein n=1 Tax=Aquitalea aquatilis TaxID=1537400 RepID=UPI0010BD4A5F|nr:MHYT domain-containing protein [Aquitalea aquatilis]